ncbi:S-4TM family putative pore-forming effector [Slackia equolifaciens]|uniref:S-4TM family putative pore-forming effector n=1 Tax=Slackia equolifaciens TaxID=498718 RepID=UPI0011CE44CC|nr:S-4TM family putative pore-forming effector [Slackia equolifaciens]
MIVLNSGARINEIQNSEESKRLLAAQRQTYTDAKLVDLVNACVCLLLPLGVTVAQIFLNVPSEAIILVWIATVVAGICLPKRSKHLVDEAAAMQQRFDSDVFGIKFENVSRDDRRIASQAGRYRERHDGDGKFRLDNWYSVDIEDARPGDAIARCQRQNTEWTKRLLKRSICIEICIAVIVAAALAVLVLRLGINPFNLFFLFSIIGWMIQRVVECRDAFARVGALAYSLSSFRLSSKEDILRVQEKIFEYRKAPYLVPDWLYALFKGRDETATMN